MKLKYDLHIHSCLSPCGDEDMTPFNIVNMAKLAGYDVIAIIDHNTTKNCAAAVEAGREIGLTVVPGMELTTAEEVHVACYFPTLEAADKFCEHVYSLLPQRKNRPKAFGHQWLMGPNDEVLGEDEHLLAASASIGIYEVAKLVASYGGFAVPAHINRASYSLINNMGIVDPAMGFTVFELTQDCDLYAIMGLMTVENPKFISGSDAHDLVAIPDATRELEAQENTAGAVIEAIIYR